MRHFFVENIPEVGGGALLSPEDSRHIIKVLRFEAGAELILVDGKGTRAEASITNADFRKCQAVVIKSETIVKERNYRLAIAIAPTKNLDRTTFFVEKAVEIGVDEILFFFSQNSERKQIKLERVGRIAIAALKQSRAFYLPILKTFSTFEELVKSSHIPYRFMAYVPESPQNVIGKNLPLNKEYLVAIGPEGGFTNEEANLAKENGFDLKSMGKARLRTETAGVFACNIINFLHL